VQACWVIVMPKHDIDTASEEPTRLDVADMVCVGADMSRRHVGVSVVLGGGNPRHDIDITNQGCCVASCCAAVSSSRCATLSSSCGPLTAPPSHRPITQAGCCIASRNTTLLSSHHAALLLERPHPQSAGTTKSQRRVGTRKRPPPKKP